MTPELTPQEIEQMEKIIKKHIPNGIVNLKAIGKGNGKPQYQAELRAITSCMTDYAKFDRLKHKAEIQAYREALEDIQLLLSGEPSKTKGSESYEIAQQTLNQFKEK